MQVVFMVGICPRTGVEICCWWGFAGHWGGDLSSRIRASDYIESLRNVACSVSSNPVVVYNFFFLLAAKAVCLRFILTLVVNT